MRPGPTRRDGSGDARRRGGRAAGPRPGLAPAHRGGRASRRPSGSDQPPPGPEQAKPGSFPETGFDAGYHIGHGVPVRAGRLHRAGTRHGLDADGRPAAARTRSPRRCSGCWSPRTPATASASTLDWTRYLFINVDLTVHLHRMPAGEWVCLDAVTLPGAERRRDGRQPAARRARPDRAGRPDAAGRGSRRAALRRPALAADTGSCSAGVERSTRSSEAHDLGVELGAGAIGAARRVPPRRSRAGE